MSKTYYHIEYDGPYSNIVRTTARPEHDGEDSTFFTLGAAKADLLEQLTYIRDDYAHAVRRIRELRKADVQWEERAYAIDEEEDEE